MGTGSGEVSRGLGMWGQLEEERGHKQELRAGEALGPGGGG